MNLAKNIWKLYFFFLNDPKIGDMTEIEHAKKKKKKEKGKIQSMNNTEHLQNKGIQTKED